MTYQNLEPGLVVAGHGRHVWVETPDGRRLICHPRGKRSQTVVGDRVLWQASSDAGTIEQVLPRKNLFYRRDEIRTKSFASNLDQVLVLIAAEPEFSESQLCRALIAAEAANIRPIIGVNKCDLATPYARTWERMKVYRDMGYAVVSMALKPEGNSTPPTATYQLLPYLQGKHTLVLGPSGVGKSTLVNRLVPGANVGTSEISVALSAGKHTTTSTSLYWMDVEKTTALIDSPGFQEFGLQHIDPMHLARLMPDIGANAQACKFYNCSHRHEPGCSVLGAMASEGASPPVRSSRYKIYCELFTELTHSRHQ